MLIYSFFSIKMASAALIQTFWQPSSSLTLWAGPQIFSKLQVYTLPHAMYVAMFQNNNMGDPGIFWLISP